jgi:hypothetical protein
MGEPKTEYLELNYRPLPASDVPKAYEIEIAGIPYLPPCSGFGLVAVKLFRAYEESWWMWTML